MHISDMLLNTYLGSGFVIITIFFKIKEEDSATISKPVQNYTPSSQHTPPKKTPSRAHLECSAMDDNFLCEEMKNLLLHVLMIFFPLARLPFRIRIDPVDEVRLKEAFLLYNGLLFNFLSRPRDLASVVQRSDELWWDTYISSQFTQNANFFIVRFFCPKRCPLVLLLSGRERSISNLPFFSSYVRRKKKPSLTAGVRDFSLLIKK
ncbi:hypothetical protein OIU78_014690 [Salix suchowensis]|jgi:hypothetical protein|nr:hypothetical protein OIU78_014690 [Salix suchowensis]